MGHRLSEKQIAAITIMAQPKRAGLTYKEVADRVGVSRMTLHRWRNDDAFCDELKRTVVRNTLDRLPDVLESVPDHIINEGNAAMLRTYLQMHGLLVDKTDITATHIDSGSGDGDLEALRKRAKELREGNE
ncbi:MAG: phBC6A51 family helix-turn-helix protein [Sporolactobacillus sp.]|jgi:transcriptional regulator with XRE-family HTH domain|nr:phBC6A51 family helix-turn-helix protein [Sporolactobacillus sp.]